ncbi:MAG: hypothetical protein OXU20_02980 [Myxococcales bacterium]|nr:hypothetical protein [Myxococcales bacterium]MDD9971826.1 hypothetical protein [Myxococcales bacterium]
MQTGAETQVSKALAQHGDVIATIEVRHLRAWSFRPWGLFIGALRVLGFLVLIPLWIVLLFSADAGEPDASDDTDRRPKGRRRSYRVNSLAHYHHDLEVRLLDAAGAAIDVFHSRPRSQTEGWRLFATVLGAARDHRWIVSETLAIPGRAGAELQELVQHWYGGRPLMSRPDLRDARALEGALGEVGFELAREGDRVELTRTYPPPSPLAALAPFLVLVGALVASAFVTPLGPLLPIVILPFAVVAHARKLWELTFELICALLRQSERYQLTVSPGYVSYRGSRAWRRREGTTEGDVLIAVGASGSLDYARGVQRQPALVRLIGERHTLTLPEGLCQHVSLALSDWLASTILTLNENLDTHDHRSRCPYCSTLFDIRARPRCPSCGAFPTGADSQCAAPPERHRAAG